MSQRTAFCRLPARQRGAAAVEFALVAIIFFMLLIGIVEMGRVLFTWNAAVEATRYGARIAVVCGIDDKTAILSHMRRIMPALEDESVRVCYADNFEGAAGPEGCASSCSVSTCKQVSVSVEGTDTTLLIPRWLGRLVMPPFATTLPRESLNAIEGHPNPVCSST